MIYMFIKKNKYALRTYIYKNIKFPIRLNII